MSSISPHHINSIEVQPVSREVIENNRKLYAIKSQHDGKSATPFHPKQSPEMLTPRQLKKSILAEKNSHIQLSHSPKTWEDSKPCKDEEYGVWRDAAYVSYANKVCRDTCTVVSDCLKNDRFLGGEPGIRAGMDQITRQDIYLRELDLGGVVDAIYVARTLMKLKLS